MREPYQGVSCEEDMRKQIRGLSFRDYIVYRYADLSRMGKRSPGDKIIRTALLVLADPDFPTGCVSFAEIVNHVSKSGVYKGRRTHTYKALRSEYAGYKGWLVALKLHFGLGLT